MNRIALIGASTLIGDEIKDELGRSRELWEDLKLLTFEPESLGKVADLDGDATFVQPVDSESLEGVDLVIVTGERALQRDLASELPGEARILIVAPESPIEGAYALIDGVNLVGGQLPEAAQSSRLLVSPHAAAITLALLANPLRNLGLERADAMLLRPSSSHGQGGLDELLEQSRKILGFQNDVPKEVFGQQLAYNLLQSSPPGGVLEDLSVVLEGSPQITLMTAQASVFHGCSLALHLSFGGAVDTPAIQEALADAPFVSRSDGSQLGPIDSAGQADILVGQILADPTSQDGGSGFWLWAVFDNLTRGGALNAVAIVAALGAPNPN